MTKNYRIAGTFVVLFPIDNHKDTSEEINFLQDVIRNALEKDHIKVKEINVQIIREIK